MFAARYFASSYWAARYFPEVGADAVTGVTRFLALSTASGYVLIQQTA